MRISLSSQHKSPADTTIITKLSTDRGFFLSLRPFSSAVDRLQILYSRIAVALWRSSCGLERHIALQNTTMIPNGGGGYSQNTYSTSSCQSMAMNQQQLGGVAGAGLHRNGHNNNRFSFHKRQPGKLERRQKIRADCQVTVGEGEAGWTARKGQSFNCQSNKGMESGWRGPK